MLPNGKAIQAATSHYLGQNFSRAFNITFLDKNEKKQHVHQNSWGFATRSIGIMIMLHSDNKGLVIPPRVAENKIVIIPIIFDKTKEPILKEAEKLSKELEEFNPVIDNRDDYSAGWKYSEWELKGIPIRIELGPKDLEKKQVILVRRDTNEKKPVKLSNIKKEIQSELEAMQKNLLARAQSFLKHSIQEVETEKEFLKAISNKKLALASWCNTESCEENIKDISKGAKSINIPFEYQKNIKGNCIICKKPATCRALFGKGY